MFFRQLFHSESCTYTYLLADENTREAMIIDSVRSQVDLYCQLFSEYGVSLVKAFDTHVHADHVTALGLLREKTGCEVLMGEKAQVDGVDRFFASGEAISVGEVSVTALYTPGHTADSYCFVMADRVFTGDTLLIRATGRTDFQEGDALAQYDSLFNQLLTLPDETWVYPGHNYKGIMVSTIGEEKRFNPRLQVNSAEEYAAIMDNLNLPKPKMIEVALKENVNCGLGHL